MLRASLDYNEEVHQSIILGGWSNMIGSENGFFTSQGTLWPKTSPVENFKYGWKIDMVANKATFFARGVLKRSSFLGNLKPSDKKLHLWRTPTLFY